MTAKKIQPTNPAVVPAEAKDVEDKTETTRKTNASFNKHRTSGRKTSGVPVKH